MKSMLKKTQKTSEPTLPKRGSVVIGKKSSETRGPDTDYIEVNFEIAASIDYQKASAKVGFRTSDPAFLPTHGKSKAELKKSLKNALITCIEVSEDTSFAAVFDALEVMRAEKAKVEH
jgi:hypothetical protein